MKFRGHALAAFFISIFWSSQNFGPGLGLGPGPGWALAGWAKIEGLGKVKYGVWDFSGSQMENRHRGWIGMGLGMPKT